MKTLGLQLVALAIFMTTVRCENFVDKDSTLRLNALLSNNEDSNDSSMEKRQERYAFGLGRRAYTYTSGGSGVKRLPVYNFGLGKRARPYSFGLGKRSDLEDEYSDAVEGLYDSWQMEIPNADKYDNMKRGRPYSFGLGKRVNLQNDQMERRSSDKAQRYNFGLGKR